MNSLEFIANVESLAFCEVCQLDKQGWVVSGGCYYDQYTLLTQLGHIQPPAASLGHLHNINLPSQRRVGSAPFPF
jgi:hypothetical protein